MLPFDIKTAGDIFVEEMNRILKDLEGVKVIADDILVHGVNIKQHNDRLEALLKHAKEVDLRLSPK